MSALTSNRTDKYKPLLFVFCLFALCWIAVLLFAGGFTTSIKAGMAFLDWPLSNGSFNPEGWLTETDKLAEHSHRLLGMKIGLLSIILLVWTHLRESRRWIRRLTYTLVSVVILQGLLGGARVRFDQLNIMTDHNLIAQSCAVIHACGAMIVLCILVALTLANTRTWIDGSCEVEKRSSATIRKWGIVATISIFIQILVGAVMRHADAGLAIAKFPLATQTSILPSYWDFGISVHFAHRIGAVIVTIILLTYLGKIWGSRSTKRALGYGALLIALGLGMQIYLGALTIWTVKNPYVATAHHLIGAFLLASTWGLTFLSHHPNNSSPVNCQLVPE